MVTTHITVSAKKGHERATLWLIKQIRPFPSISGGHSMGWQGGDGLFGEYGNPARGIGNSYRAELLRSDFSHETATGNRCDFAGYTPERNGPENPGAIVLRGKSLGETSVEIDSNGWSRWRVRGFDTPTDGETAFLNEQVLPSLLSAIQANAADLRREAIEGIRESCAQAISEARETLDKLEREALKAIAAL